MAANSTSEYHPTARDLMDPHPTVLHPSDKVGKGVKCIMEHRYRRLPVVDDEGRFKGVFGVNCLLRLVLPKAVVMDKGLSTVPFVRDTLSDLHKRLKEIEDEPISMCMHHESIQVSPDTPLIETLLILYNTRASLPVVDPDTDKLVGVISYFDVGHKVLDAEV